MFLWTAGRCRCGVSYRSIGRLFACALAILSSSGESHAVWQQSPKLYANDGVAGDNFGSAIALSGTTAVVGSRHDDDLGMDSGAAYLIDAATGTQLGKLLPNDGAADDLFGYAVGIRGATAIVGAFQDDDLGPDSGSAYLFDVATGTQTRKLIASDGAAGDLFGVAVAVGSTLAVVGAYGDDIDDDQANGELYGSAYLFDISTGAQTLKLLPTLGGANEWFGYSVGISGNTAIVGSPLDGDLGANSGSAFLFDTTTGVELHKLLPNDGSAGDNFGISVAISGNRAIVGSYFDNPSGATSGSAYLFDVSTGAQLAKLTPNDGTAGDNFGASVAISGNTAIVGAPFDNASGFGSGSAYLFDVSTGAFITKLVSSAGGVFDQFGSAVAISGGVALAGSFGDNDRGSLAGSVTPFKSLGITGFPGDYNQDGAVDAADYTVWRDALGGASALPNDDTPGIDVEDFTRWRNNFGQPAPALSGQAVPESGGTVLSLAVWGALYAARRRY